MPDDDFAAGPIPTFDGDQGGIPARGTSATSTGNPGNSGGGGAASPYVEVAPPLPEVNVLDQLREDLAADDGGAERLRLVLRRDPRYVVIYTADLDGDEIDKADRYAGGNAARQRNQYSTVKYSSMIAALKCVAIERDGVELADDSGSTLRFAHRWLMAAITDPATRRPVATAADCARYFYRDDADLDAVVREIWTKSGWQKDAEVATADPLDGGSSV